eukprot:COSAG01_NODE_942_length_12551_cov_47.129216_2_plen_254_part_00
MLLVRSVSETDCPAAAAEQQWSDLRLQVLRWGETFDRKPLLLRRFSNGCTIGCAHCDGSSNLFGHGSNSTPAASFIYKGGLPIPPWTPPPGTMVLDPTKPQPRAASMCARPTTNATICDPRLRTVNTQAACGSAEDYLFFSPWRAPGSAPVTTTPRDIIMAAGILNWLIFTYVCEKWCAQLLNVTGQVLDSCGAAGGRYKGTGMGAPGSGASFQNSSVASLGDLGSKTLPRMPSQATWVLGSTAEVSSNIKAI